MVGGQAHPKGTRKGNPWSVAPALPDRVADIVNPPSTWNQLCGVGSGGNKREIERSSVLVRGITTAAALTKSPKRGLSCFLVVSKFASNLSEEYA